VTQSDLGSCIDCDKSWTPKVAVDVKRSGWEIVKEGRSKQSVEILAYQAYRRERNSAQG
jgi:hypothetical protein